MWLDKYIKEQEEQQNLMLRMTGGINPSELQELYESGTI